MEKKSKGKTMVIVILVLAVLGLGGYIIYDKFINKEDNTAELQGQIKKLNQEIETLKSNGNKDESINNLIGAYSGTVEAQAEIGRPIENIELLIKDANSAVYCSQLGTGMVCYKGTYIIKDKKIFLHFTEKHNFEFLGDDNVTKTESGIDNEYEIFTLEQENLIYDNNGLSGILSKTDNFDLKYINNMK